MSEHFVELKFGTSGLRDTVENMTDMECYINTKGFLLYLKKIGEFKSRDKVALAGDRRPSTRRIKKAVAMAIHDMGGVSDDQGLVPSPSLAFYAMKRGIASIMVTGSHIPSDRNGIKFTKKSGEVLKSDEQGILESVRDTRNEIAESTSIKIVFNKKRMFTEKVALEAEFFLKEPEYAGESAVEYIKRYTDIFGFARPLTGKKIFLYQHSAVGRDIIKEIFEGAGAGVYAPSSEITLQYKDENEKGKSEKEFLRSKAFISVDTESVSNKTMAVFEKVMNDENIDIGISMDGDSDRPLLVYRVYENNKPTKEVRYVTGDVLGLLTIMSLENMDVRIDAIAVPVSANDMIDEILLGKGVKISRTKIGSPYVIAAMNESISRYRNEARNEWNVFSWEANGGFLTGSNVCINNNILTALPTRDACLPLLAVIIWAEKQKKKISQIIDSLPKRFTHADRIKDFSMEYSARVLNLIRPKKEKEVVEIEFTGGALVKAFYNGDVKKNFNSGEFFEIKKTLEKFFNINQGFAEIIKINYVDGVRIYFANGEVAHLRPSGNAPEFRNYSLAGTPNRAREIVKMVLEEIVPRMAKEGKDV
ncbi:phosphoglucomutase/phosphomannomutase alpha/beta/alpha domain I [Candidatus Omnitrophus magneticus]|uniref:Phosphoglucomutase/phosphomannomutase alpha/beta/alpha domain I n=1 Tax=Candidatus Omnitrophus magneticus TaxID=1609969 RepID=A0A0F0CUK2_9BACT|nr:phosphoglucomutase/phosphomannomutase alpha/beta/alpha domain I [Candidatus Omnitrophus magneticus]